MRALASVGGGFVDGLRMLLGRPRFLVMLLLMLGAAWLGSSIYQRAVARDIPIAVLDFDGSSLSRALRNALDAAPELELVQRPIGSVQEAEELLHRGEIVGVFVIPDDMTVSLTRGARAHVQLAVDMSNIVTGRTALRAAQKIVATVGGAVQLEVTRKLGERREKALARVAPVAVDEHISFNPTTNYVIYIVPTAVFFFLHVYVLIAAASLFLPTTSVPGAFRKLGASLAIAVLSFGAGALFFYGLLPVQGVTAVSGPATLLGALGVLIAVDLLMAVAFAMVAPSPFLALEVTVVLGMLSMMLSGVTWPTDMFPGVLQQLADLIPLTPFAKAMRVFLHYETSFRELAPWLRVFLTQAALFGGLALVGGLLRWALSRVRRVRRVAEEAA